VHSYPRYQHRDGTPTPHKRTRRSHLRRARPNLQKLTTRRRRSWRRRSRKSSTSRSVPSQDDNQTSTTTNTPVIQDKYLRSVADFRNLQERTKREVASARDFAISRFAKDLIDSIDNLDRALSTVQPSALTSPDANKDLVSLHDGLKMTETILMNTLKKHGLERFDPAVEGEKFDPNKHEATFMTPQKDKEDGTVFFTQQKGFSLNGRVLRAAKVGVVKNT